MPLVPRIQDKGKEICARAPLDGIGSATPLSCRNDLRFLTSFIRLGAGPFLAQRVHRLRGVGEA